MCNETIKAGDKIHFLNTLDEAACDEHHGRLYASKGEEGVIVEAGGCREGFWVKTDINPKFGCERGNFELINLTSAMILEKLNMFTSRGTGRKYINDVCFENGRTIATNGHVMAWVNKDLGLKSRDGFPRDSADELVEKHGNSEFKPFKMPDLDLRKCDTCSGDGYSYKVKCVECEGEGEVCLESDYNHYNAECKRCNGKGCESVPSGNSNGMKEPCMKCESGFIFEYYIEVEGVNIDPRYLHLIKDYPNLQIATDPVDSNCSAKVFYFKSSNNINAIIMGANS